MFERYTEKARKVIFRGRYEASIVNSPIIQPEHLLLGLIRVDKRFLSDILPTGERVEHLMMAIQEKIIVLPERVTTIDIPFSPETKKVVEDAATLAEEHASSTIATHHLLLVIVGGAETVFTSTLKEFNITPETVKQQILKNSSVQNTTPVESPISIIRKHVHDALALLDNPLSDNTQQHCRLKEHLVDLDKI